jgi:signal transduction histidine kinase
MMQRLFEPFATGSARGTGLGLAIAKAAVEAHRGQIQAENRHEGGARFHIVLPVLEQL